MIMNAHGSYVFSNFTFRWSDSFYWAVFSLGLEILAGFIWGISSVTFYFFTIFQRTITR